MNQLEQHLHKTKKSVPDVCALLEISEEDNPITSICQCTSCNVWRVTKILKPDQDGYLVCPECIMWYGD